MDIWSANINNKPLISALLICLMSCSAILILLMHPVLAEAGNF